MTKTKESITLVLDTNTDPYQLIWKIWADGITTKTEWISDLPGNPKIPVSIRYTILNDYGDDMSGKRTYKNGITITLELRISIREINQQYPPKVQKKWGEIGEYVVVYKISEAEFRRILTQNPDERTATIEQCIKKITKGEAEKRTWLFHSQSIVNCLVYIMPSSLSSLLR